MDTVDLEKTPGIENTIYDKGSAATYLPRSNVCDALTKRPLIGETVLGAANSHVYDVVQQGPHGRRGIRR